MFRSAASRIAAAIVLFGLVPGTLHAAEKPVVTVFAAASLREAFDAAAPAFTRATGYPVRFSFAGSDTLAAQLLQGAPADVFASANAEQMQRVAQLVDTPRTLAHNHLVIIAPKNDPAVTSVMDLGKPGIKVVLAATSVPAGAYARQAFAALTAQRSYGDDFAVNVGANVVSEETDVKAVATKVALGEADAGVVYATDLIPIASRVRAIGFPRGAVPPVTYLIAAVRAAPNPTGARAFVGFVTSAAGKALLKARGFAE